MSQQDKEFFEETGIHFTDYLKHAISKWYLFVISIILCVLIAYIYTGKVPKVYERNAQIMFSEDNKQNIGRLGEITSPESTLELSIKKDANNEKELFASKKLMLGVVKALKL
ncbi:MAG: hypothetical protein LBH82_06890, partial [Bacteroidales bacterium]|nr:hypothetical protein [Bacteroidales bacterium]